MGIIGYMVLIFFLCSLYNCSIFVLLNFRIGLWGIVEGGEEDVGGGGVVRGVRVGDGCGVGFVGWEMLFLVMLVYFILWSVFLVILIVKVMFVGLWNEDGIWYLRWGLVSGGRVGMGEGLFVVIGGGRIWLWIGVSCRFEVFWWRVFMVLKRLLICFCSWVIWVDMFLNLFEFLKLG